MAVSAGEMEAVLRLRDEMSQAIVRAMETVRKETKQASTVAGQSFTQLGGTLRSFGTGLSVAVTLPIAAAGTAIIGAAMNAVESENLFQVSFGGMADAARDWSEQVSEALKVNEYELRRNSATLFTMFESMGLAKQGAFDMSTGLTQLSLDMASFYNLRPDEAFDKLRAGIVGESEPLKRLGILIDETTVKTAAYTAGIAKQGAELTQQQKVQARFIAIMEQTAKAQGDLARTADSPTNALRSFRQMVGELSVELGTALLPVVSDALRLLTSFLPHVEAAVKWFAALPEPVRNVALGVAAVAAAIGPILVPLGLVVSAIGSLAPMLPAVATGFALMTGPIGAVVLAVTALAGAVLLFKNRIDDVTKRGESDGKYFTEAGKKMEETAKKARELEASAKPLASGFKLVIEQFAHTKDAATNFDILASRIAQARKEVSDLSPAVRSQLVQALKSGAFGMEELQKATGLSDMALKLFSKSLDAADDAAEDAEKHLDALIGSMKDFRAEALSAAQAVGAGMEGFVTAFRVPIMGPLDSTQISQSLAKLAPAIKSGVDTWKPSIAKVFGDSFMELPGLLVKAFTGGGGLSGAFQALGTMLVDGLFGPKGAFGTSIPKALASFIPMIGGLMGPLIEGMGKLFSKVFKSEGKKVNDMRDAFQATLGTFDQMAAKAAGAGYQIERLLNTKKVKDFEREMQALKEAIAFQEQAMQSVVETAQKYGITIEQLGPTWARQELDKKAQELFRDFQILQSAGVDMQLITDRMGESMSAFVQQALRTGSEIPEAMRPMVQAMIDNGDLVDENGVAYESMEAAGIKFAMTMTEGFKAMIEETKKLTEAILRAIGALPKSIDIPVRFPSEGGPHVPSGPDVEALGLSGRGGRAGLTVIINAQGAFLDSPAALTRLADKVDKSLQQRMRLYGRRQAA